MNYKGEKVTHEQEQIVSTFVNEIDHSGQAHAHCFDIEKMLDEIGYYAVLKQRDNLIEQNIKLGSTNAGLSDSRDELKAHIELINKTYSSANTWEDLGEVLVQRPRQNLIDRDKSIAKQAFIQGFLASGQGYNGEIECGEAPESLIEQAEEYAESLGSNEDGNE